MPDHIKFLAKHAAAGFAFGVFIVFSLMLFDLGGLRSLMWASSERWLALGIFSFFMGLTFGSVQMGIAIMKQSDKDDDDDKKGRGPKMPDVIGILAAMVSAPAQQPVKIPVRANNNLPARRPRR